MGLLWDFYGIFMGILWDFYGNLMGLKPCTPGKHRNSWDLWMFIPLKMVLIQVLIHSQISWVYSEIMTLNTNWGFHNSTSSIIPLFHVCVFWPGILYGNKIEEISKGICTQSLIVKMYGNFVSYCCKPAIAGGFLSHGTPVARWMVYFHGNPSING